MSTTDQPGPQLTRRQLREMRLTGQTPVITPEHLAQAQRAAAAEPEASTAPEHVESEASDAADRPAADERPALSASTPDDEHPRTRRQAREFERVRTASVPIILPAVATPTDDADAAGVEVPSDESADGGESNDRSNDVDTADAGDDSSVGAETDAEAESDSADAQASDDDADGAVIEVVSGVVEIDDADTNDAEIVELDVDADVIEDSNADAVDLDDESTDDSIDDADQHAPVSARADSASVAVVAPVSSKLVAGFGDGVIGVSRTGDSSVPSFDALLTRDSSASGTASGSSALILSEAPMAPLTAPVTSSGETLITGSFTLPESLSSQGHAGAADGKDVDAVLIDGELAPASSPTPIAATAAVSQAKAPGEIIQPPAPEKGNKLMLALAITTGALALALGAFIVYTIVTGAMQ